MFPTLLYVMFIIVFINAVFDVQVKQINRDVFMRTASPLSFIHYLAS